ncbi:M14 family zinc carboxypeptidase [Blattabacterium cuenoti]|uniref:M14 family zinc carboxypeptidase n=1 Tax=Blattabacterium cuenoti TaxID=1653831 RepID=UPI001EEA0494|nr:M14 family zinc carboxypeptidase [Blattabacterium cuenoti]
MLNLDIPFLFSKYDDFKDKSIFSYKLFKHSHLLKTIEKYKNMCMISHIGSSIEDRKIFKIQWGDGDYKVFIWSQMHGNETTGTKSMFDILHFFVKNENYDIVKFIRKKLTILFIPMLNPDGSEKYQRRNSVNIDLNRDAIRLQTPEIKVLISEINKIKPNFLFNLHDQKSVYNIGYKCFNPAILSFLCPSVKGDHEVFSERKKAMGLISSVEKSMKDILPCTGSIGRYSSEFYPTATGDFFQEKGYPCVLIEAGNYPKDPLKKLIRKYKALSILIGLYNLSYHGEENLEKKYSHYFTIPKNRKKLLDKIYRKIKIEKKNYNFLVDIGIMIQEKFNPIKKDIDFLSKIVDIGDLSDFFSYEDIFCHGKKFYREKGNNYPEIGDIESFYFV